MKTIFPDSSWKLEAPRNRISALMVSLFLTMAAAPAAVLYVDINSANPTPPYTNWVTAATNIQDAVDAGVAGDQILVTNGVYQTGGRTAPIADGTNRVAVEKAVLVMSVNGPAFTMISGSGTMRCAYLTNGAILSGFTLTNGSGSLGGGVYCRSTNPVVTLWPVVTNCALVGNSATASGGGVYQGALNNCTLRGNTAGHPGGGQGGGAARSILVNCALIGNSSVISGGGSENCVLTNCVLQGNSSTLGGGDDNGLLYNCLLTGNSAASGGGQSGGRLYNCTVTGNTAVQTGGGTVALTHINCILYYNTAPEYENYVAGTFIKCCTTPSPGSGGANITNPPIFIDPAGSNFRLLSNSPCINAAGGFAFTTTDLDGRPRIADGALDLGAYEFQPGVSGAFLGWLQQYGLPSDGSADTADPDGDGLNDWQEWIVGTIPTNAASALRLLSPTKVLTGIDVAWQSVTNRTYLLERANNFSAPSPFSLVASNIVGQAGTTTFTDTNAVGPGPFYYRVGVGE